MSTCRVPWCILPGGHEAECANYEGSPKPPRQWPTREAMAEAFAVLLERIERIEAQRAKPDVERALIVQAVRETMAGLEGP